MNGKKTIFFTVVLVMVIGSGCWLALNAAKNILHARDVSAQNPDSFMHQVIYTQMDEAGSIRHQITAPSLTHYPHGDTSIFERPHLLVFNAAQKLWEINSDQGESVAAVTKIYLSGNVNVVRLPTPVDLGFVVKTTVMTVYPDGKIAETKEPVTILQSGSVVNAVGAKADLARGTINLLSQVKGSYIPSPNDFSGFSTDRPEQFGFRQGGEE